MLPEAALLVLALKLQHLHGSGDWYGEVFSPLLWHLRRLVICCPLYRPREWIRKFDSYFLCADLQLMEQAGLQSGQASMELLLAHHRAAGRAREARSGTIILVLWMENLVLHLCLSNHLPLLSSCTQLNTPVFARHMKMHVHTAE